ncbi:PREDICTED: proline-rich protein 36-like, partial [Cyphomyrmex costatus]|uniref:proline-rich protein 36-like n=1 Tax=Cyphomyrmex costatus TaxID=456900 RepID=UPI0008523036
QFKAAVRRAYQRGLKKGTASEKKTAERIALQATSVIGNTSPALLQYAAAPPPIENIQARECIYVQNPPLVALQYSTPAIGYASAVGRRPLSATSQFAAAPAIGYMSAAGCTPLPATPQYATVPAIGYTPPPATPQYAAVPAIGYTPPPVTPQYTAAPLVPQYIPNHTSIQDYPPPPATPQYAVRLL